MKSRTISTAERHSAERLSHTPRSAGSGSPARWLADRIRSNVMPYLLTAYFVGLGLVMILAGIRPTPDVLLVALLGVVLLLGRSRLFFRDWLPFLLILLAWDAMRGIADDLGTRVLSDEIIAMERALFGGIIPTVELQEALFVPGRPTPLDISASLLYTAHFVFPIGVGFALWLADRSLFHRFAIALLLVAVMAFICNMLIPVAPPRFAYRHGEALPVWDVLPETMQAIGLHPTTVWAYRVLNPNENAAMPSLHAAFPTLASLFLLSRWPRVGLLAVLYTAAVWFAITYLGHHYVVDAIGGALVAFIGFAAVSRWPAIVASWISAPAEVRPAHVPTPVLAEAEIGDDHRRPPPMRGR
jgi:membrane-associated phospholipid phosphatase